MNIEAKVKVIERALAPFSFYGNEDAANLLERMAKKREVRIECPEGKLFEVRYGPSHGEGTSLLEAAMNAVVESAS